MVATSWSVRVPDYVSFLLSECLALNYHWEKTLDPLSPETVPAASPRPVHQHPGENAVASAIHSLREANAGFGLMETRQHQYLGDAILVNDLPDVPVFFPRCFPEPEGGDEGILIRETLRKHISVEKQSQLMLGCVRAAGSRQEAHTPDQLLGPQLDELYTNSV